MKLNAQDIRSDVYNLILNSKTSNSERALLLAFKNNVESGKDFDKSLMELAEGLRQLGVANLSKNQHMSSAVDKFYMKISAHGQLGKAIGRGLLISGMRF